MATVSNSANNDLFPARSSGVFMDAFWKSLSGRMAVMEGEECLQLLQQVRGELVAEEAVDAAIFAEIETLLAMLPGARFSDEIKEISGRIVSLVAKHFKARSSVSAVHYYSTACREKLLGTGLTLAAELLKLEGVTAPTDCHALLACGDLGRSETRMRSAGPLLLITADSFSGGEENIHLLALKLEAILIECRLPFAAETNNNRFWHGSVARWLKGVESGFAGENEGRKSSFAQTFEMVADSRCLCGDDALAGLALARAGSLLQDKLQSEDFRRYAKSVANMPVALGMFGRFRTVRTGKHRGEFSLEDLAIAPLIAAVRILAVHQGITVTATAARIRSLLEAGILSVNLAERLLTVFQDFIRYQLELEISSNGNGKLFCNPEALHDEVRDRFKDGLEDIGTLQRLVYQQIVEVA